MEYSIGQLVGGTFAVFLLYFIWEWALFMRIMDDPMRGKLLSVLAAYFTASTVYGFGAANGGPYILDGFAIYLVGGLIVSIYAWNRANKLKSASDESDAFS